MSQIVFQITMDKPTEIKSEHGTHNSEFYLLLIVIKLTLLISAKIIKGIIKLYQYHNEKVIRTHTKAFNTFNKSNVADQHPKVSQNRQADIESGHSEKNIHTEIPRKTPTTSSSSHA